ncbi:MAG: hypothetical protein WKF41_05745 [Gaiellaceae bacterium]
MSQSALIAYDEAKRALDDQAKTLDGLRARAGTLLAVASLVTSFLGGQVLAKPTIKEALVIRADIGALGWIAIAAFLGVVVATMAILWPYRDWRFNLSASTITQWDVSEAEAKGHLAIFHEENYDANAPRLQNLFWCFQAGCLLLGIETIAWILDLAEVNPF